MKLEVNRYDSAHTDDISFFVHNSVATVSVSLSLSLSPNQGMVVRKKVQINPLFIPRPADGASRRERFTRSVTSPGETTPDLGTSVLTSALLNLTCCYYPHTLRLCVEGVPRLQKQESSPAILLSGGQLDYDPIDELTASKSIYALSSNIGTCLCPYFLVISYSPSEPINIFLSSILLSPDQCCNVARSVRSHRRHDYTIDRVFVVQ